MTTRAELEAQVEALFPDNSEGAITAANAREQFNTGIELYQLASYGGISLSTPTPIADLGAGYITLPADEVAVSAPVGVVQSTANNSLAFASPGVYNMSINLGLEHDELNQGRIFRIQVYNTTKAISGRSIAVGTGRNTSATNAGFSALVEVGPGNLGDEFVVRVGGGDAYSLVIVEGYGYDVSSVGAAQ